LTRGARVRYAVAVGGDGEVWEVAHGAATRRRPVFGRLLAVEYKRPVKEGGVRVTTAYNRMLGLPGAWVRDVEFGAEAMIVTVALRRTRPVCSGCGARGLKVKDHRVKRWRHLDVGGVRCYIECRMRRLYCPGCGDRPEMVEWARGGVRYTRDFEDLLAWLAQQMSQTQLTRLLRIGW
jgi:transposase